MTPIPLRYLVRINTQVLPESTNSDYRFRYVEISDVSRARGVNLEGETVTFDEAPSRARRLAAPGDTVVSTVRTYLRAVAEVPASKVPLVFSTGFAVLEPVAVESRFLSYAARSELFIHEVVARSTGVSYPAINASELLAISIPVPSAERQRRIADFLDDRVARIDRIIAARRREVTIVQQGFEATRRTAALGLSCEDIVQTPLPWATQVATGWKVRQLRHLAQIGTGHTPSRSVSEYWADCTIPWLTTTDVHKFRKDEIDSIAETENQISHLGLANSAAVVHPRRTVALSRTASAGFSVVMDRDMATSQDFVTWTCGPNLEPRYLLALLRIMRPYLLGFLATGSTHKTIYFPDLQDLRIPVPSLAAQRAAVDGVDAAAQRHRTVTTMFERQIDLLTEYKTSLITAAVTGELDVTTAGSGIPNA